MGVLSLLLSTFYPTYCFLCLKKGSFICSACLIGLEFYQKPCCPVCKGVLRSKCKFIHTICKKHSYLDGLFPVVHYDKKAKLILKEAKYHFVSKALGDIAYLMKNKYSNFPFAVDYVVPVPLSRERLNWRGYNQAGILAKIINWQSKNVLKKETHTHAQAKLKRWERLGNLKNSFCIDKNFDVKGKVIVLVDDVTTTQATLQECACVLKNAGAKNVYGLVWAKD